MMLSNLIKVGFWLYPEYIKSFVIKKNGYVSFELKFESEAWKKFLSNNNNKTSDFYM